MLSVKYNHMCRYLIIEGADVNSKTSDGNALLNHAIINDHNVRMTKTRVSVVSLLLNGGADPFLQSDDKDDAFTTAALHAKSSTLM